MNNEFDNRIYLKKRFEEQRSKLAQIRSTFMHLAQNIKATHKVYSDIVPPTILYSEPFCARTLDTIDELMVNLMGIDVDDNYGELVRNHRFLSTSIGNMMKVLTAFQHLQDQRISGLHSSKIIESQPAMQSEYSLMLKVYNAVDALSYQLMVSCYGEDWVRKMQYVPLSLFDQTYSILQLSTTEPSSLITIPYYDCFRARFWPGLAHEVAHSFVAIVATTKFNSSLFECMDGEISVLVDALFSDRVDRRDIYAENSMSHQISEIVSDIIAAYICGPASLFSGSSMLSFSSRWGHVTFFDAIRYSCHPPIEIRVAAMKKVLELSKIPQNYPYFTELMDDTERVLKGKNIMRQELIRERDDGYTRASCRFDQLELPVLINKYEREIKLFVSEVVKILKDSPLTRFNKRTWEDVTVALDEGSFEDLTPIQLMNIAWAWRIKKVMGDRNLSMEQFYYKREHEPKIFETLVHHMYKFYECNVVTKVEEYVQV